MTLLFRRHTVNIQSSYLFHWIIISLNLWKWKRQ